jgi:hypothetical protein
MDEKEKHGGFIQFPLQLLATDWTLGKVMDHALSWSAHLLVKTWEKNASPLPTEQTTEDLYKRAAGVVGFNCCGRKFAPSCLSQVKEVEEKLARLLPNQEPSKIFVRLPNEYAFEIKDGQWKGPEARVYLALACIIGVQKPYALAGWPLIARRAAGIAKVGQRSATKLMTRAQVEHQLKKLRERDLFACFTYNRGVRYWSFPNKCTREQIARSVVNRVRARQTLTAETDAALTARIMAEPLKPKA